MPKFMDDKKRKLENYHSKTASTLKIKTVDYPSINQNYSESITENGCDWVFMKEEKVDSYSTSEKYKIKMTNEVIYNFTHICELESPNLKEIESKSVNLEFKRSGKITEKTLLLDLDDTLIHTINPNFNYSLLNTSHDGANTVIFKDILTHKIHTMKVLIRPHAIKLLEELSRLYEIIIFTDRKSVV